MPGLSIVIPALNEEKYLPRLLESLAHQTRKDFEVVVVDGSSRDRTVELAQSFRPRLPELQVIVSERGNVSRQRNIGARAAKAEWLAFLDADNTVLPYFVERLEHFIERQQPSLFTSWFRPDSEDSQDALFTLVANTFVEGSIFFRRPIAPGPLTVVRRPVFDAVHGFDETITFGEDYDLTRRITAHGIKMQILRETLYIFSLRRVRKDGKFRFIRLYAKGSVLALIAKRSLRRAPAYVTGGHYYSDKDDTTGSASGAYTR
jgi:glycosyltransferase involved in cell wall biosynthesis